MQGFTLFEVVLASALSAVLVGVLGTALFVYLTSVSVGRGDVEQAQLARAILSHIADDLRAAVRKVEQDVSALESQGGSSGSSGGGSLDGSGETGGSGAGSGSATAGAGGGTGGSGSGTSSTDYASTAIPPPVPGLYGNQYQLQVDISRIPRFDELDALLQADSPPAGYASDLRTVAYFVETGDYVEESSSAATGLGAVQEQMQRSGLMRRELDRATARYATEYGSADILTEGAALLAPEVTWMEFQYFDGVQLWPDWDSTDRGGLPMAVEVRIWLRPPRPEGELADLDAPVPDRQDGPSDYDEMYRLVVHLPAAEMTSADSTSTGSTGSTTGGTSSGSDAVSTGSAGGGER